MSYEITLHAILKYKKKKKKKIGDRMLLPNKDQILKKEEEKTHSFELITPDSFLSYIKNHAR